MSQPSCYNWFSWHATAPRRLNSPGISKEQLPISAPQPLFKMHCSQGNTRSNKIKWEFAATVSAVHCKMPEGKKPTQKTQNLSYGFHFKWFFSFIQSKTFWVLTYSTLKDAVWLRYIARHLQNSKEVATPFCRENMLWQTRTIYFLFFVFKLCKALSYQFSWWKLMFFKNCINLTYLHPM